MRKIFLWEMRLASNSSLLKRWITCGSVVSSESKTLIAISRPSSRSVALYTRPMPPSPSSASIRNRGPSLSPGSNIRERAPEPLELLLGEGECPLGVRTLEAVLFWDSARAGCVAPLVESEGPSIVRSSKDGCSSTRQSVQRTADSGFSRPHERHFMVEGLSVRRRKSNYPARVTRLQANSRLQC